MGHKLRIILFFSLVLVLNIAWEFFQYSLYNDYGPMSGIIHPLVASLSDLLFIGFVFLLISFRKKQVIWIEKPEIPDYVLLTISGLVISALIEVINVDFLMRWGYKPEMPLVFGIGLSPLLQLAITSLISLEISRRV